MTLSQIQYFLTAARCLNFTVAARELYITQPALGRQISAMEDELGVKLFLRSKNSLSLTPTGSMLQKEFTSLITNYNEILQKIYAMGQDDSVRMRIGILEGYGLGDVLPLSANLSGRVPPPDGRAVFPQLSVPEAAASCGRTGPDPDLSA